MNLIKTLIKVLNKRKCKKQGHILSKEVGQFFIATDKQMKGKWMLGLVNQEILCERCKERIGYTRITFEDKKRKKWVI